jgi:pyrimidine-specific ribonucleoside hydrolase
MKNSENKSPINIILGTDWWDDCDDAVAVRILARSHIQNKINLLGVGINACMDYSAVSLDAFLRSEGLADIPVGIDLDATDFGGNPPYQKNLSKLPSKYTSNRDCEDAVRLYRRILSSENGPIDIIEIGFPQILSNLLQSAPDDISNLSGKELVKNKVGKLWMMAGKWDDLENGKENNFARNERSRQAAHYLCDNFPCPITFLGWEISYDILTGSKLTHNDLLHKILCDHGSPNGRASWDPMLTLMAVINDEQQAGYNIKEGKASVDSDTGINRFSFFCGGPHKFVTKKYDNEYYKNAIDDIIK